MKVTREQILAIMPNAKDKVDDFLPYIMVMLRRIILILLYVWLTSWLRLLMRVAN